MYCADVLNLVRTHFLVVTMKKTSLKAAAYGILLATSWTANNAWSDIDMNFSGFATLGYSKASIPDTDTPVPGLTDNLEGMTEDGNFRDLNRLGLRLDVPLEDNLSFTTQFIAKGSNGYEPEVDWLFATYSFTPNISLSVGKMRTPLFMYSDYLDVGYAYQWISPPFSVYGAPTINSTEGAKLSWIADLGGSWLSEVQVWAGNSTETLEELGDIPFTLDDQVGVAWSVEYEWLTLRAVYVEGKGTITTDALTTLDGQIAGVNAGNNALAAASVPGVTAIDLSSVQDDVSYQEDKNQFFGVGAFLDFETFYIGAEASQVRGDNSLPLGELDSYYVTTGVRLPADVTLSLTYSVDDDVAKTEIYENYNALVANNVAAMAALGAGTPGDPDNLTQLEQVYFGTVGLGQGLEQAVIVQQQKERQTYTIGARWDFHRQAALKGEYILQDQTIGNTDEVSPTAFRLALDLIF